MSKYWSKLRCLKGGGSLGVQISGGKGGRPPTNFGVRKLEILGYYLSNITKLAAQTVSA